MRALRKVVALLLLASLAACATGAPQKKYGWGGQPATGGGGSSNFTAIVKDATGTPPTGNVALSSLSGPGLLKFAADGTPSKAVAGTDYPLLPSATDDIIVAGSDVQDLAIAPTAWTLNGDTDGDYEIWGDIIVPAGSGSTQYGIQINADSGANYVGAEYFGGTGVTLAAAALGTGAGLFNLSTGMTNAGHMVFYANLESKSGRLRMFNCWLIQYDATAPSYRKIDTSMVYTATATVIGPTTRLHSSVANGLKSGTSIRIRRKQNAT